MTDDMDNASQSNGSDNFLGNPPDLTNYYFPLGFVAALIVSVNSFVVISVWTNAKLRTKCNALLASLAVADGTTGLFAIPLLIVAVLSKLPDVCYVALAIHTWFWIMSICSIFHLLVIACEQYLAILRPFSHDRIVTKTSITVTLVFIWTVSIGHAFLPWTWILPLGNMFCAVESKELQRRDEIFTITSTALFFVLPLGIIIYVYIRIVMEAKRHIRRIRRESLAKSDSCRSSCIRFNFKGFYVIGLMSFVFVLCWIPFFVVVFLVTFQNKHLPFWLDYKVSVLRFFPSLLNPLMFAFWKRDFRAIFIERLRCCVIKYDRPVSISSGRQHLSSLVTMLNRSSDSKRQSV